CRRGDAPVQREQVARQVRRRHLEIDDTEPRPASHRGDVAGVDQYTLATELPWRQPVGFEVHALHDGIDGEQQARRSVADARATLARTDDHAGPAPQPRQEPGKKPELPDGSNGASHRLAAVDPYHAPLDTALGMTRPTRTEGVRRPPWRSANA